MKPLLVYCYDAWCGWCYGFSPVIKKIEEKYRPVAEFEVLSGGMILPAKPVHISAMAPYILQQYKRVEELSGITFGQDYLWHVLHAEDSDWYPNSEKPAIALCIFKQYYPERVLEFAIDLQYALHMEGRDLADNEAYRHLLEKYSISPEAFYEKLESEEAKKMAFEEFAQVKHLQVTGFPALFVQVDEAKIHLVAQGFTGFDTVSGRIDRLLSGM